MIYSIVIALFLVSFSTLGKVELAVSNATSGPAKQLGKDLNLGAKLYFDVMTPKFIDMVYLDDGYEPELTLNNTHQFDELNHKLLFNYVGTPTTKAVHNFIEKKNMLLLTPFTGADFLREEQATHIFNFRTSYKQEAEFQVEYLVEQLKLKRIAIVIQADDFGLAFEKYFIRALEDKKLRPEFVSRYKRNTEDVFKSVKLLKQSQVEAVLFVGTYQPMAALINNSIVEKPNLVYSSVSFVSSMELKKRIPEDTRLLVTEVVPNPNTCQYQECQSFRTLADSLDMSHGMFEGFLNAKWIGTNLALCYKDKMVIGSLPACLTKNLVNNKIRVFGEVKTFNAQRRQLLDKVYFTLMNLPAPNR